MKKAMLRELKLRAGIDFDDSSLSIVALYEALSMLYGESAATLMIENVLVKMDELASKRINS